MFVEEATEVFAFQDGWRAACYGHRPVNVDSKPVTRDEIGDIRGNMPDGSLRTSSLDNGSDQLLSQIPSARFKRVNLGSLPSFDE